jgi:alkaline phosphatase D
MRIGFLCGCLLLAIVRLAGAAEEPLSRVAFGSCADQKLPQPIWEAIVAAEPQRFIFLGDNIYADTQDMAELRDKYQLLAEVPGFAKLRKICPVLATWDDHDYGLNDSGGEYPKKAESQQVFLDFFEAKADDPRRSREGIYSSQVSGPAGKRTQIILLDQRYFRSPLKTGFVGGEPGEGRRGKYIGNTDAGATVLGEAQWKWLEIQLRTPAELRIIGASFQFVNDDSGSECWGNFPLERQRMLKLIRDTKAKGIVFISGDRHLAEISCLPANDPPGAGYPLYDVTSSSLNKPSGNFSKSKVRFGNEINTHRVGLTYFDVNFGFIAIDWQPADPVVRMQVRDELGGVVLQQRMSLSELAPR